MHKRKGFTLIEVIIVVLIIGILASVALPYFRGMKIKTRIAQIIIDVDEMEGELDVLLLDQGGWGGSDVNYMNDTLRMEWTSFITSARFQSYPDFYYGVASTYGASGPSKYEIVVNLRDPNAEICDRVFERDGTRRWTVIPGSEWYKYLKGVLPGAEDEP